jgi:cytidine deaminase
VGAAMLTKRGEIITGANIESASYGLTCCAERVALFNALTAGKRGFAAIAIVARAPGGPMPCGACRQLLAEYAPDAAVWVADSAALHLIREFSVKELLPAAFVEVPKSDLPPPHPLPHARSEQRRERARRGGGARGGPGGGGAVAQ